MTTGQAWIEGSEEHIRELRAAARMAAEAAELAIGRVMVAEKVIGAAREFVESFVAGSESEIAERCHELLVQLENYDNVRPS